MKATFVFLSFLLPVVICSAQEYLKEKMSGYSGGFNTQINLLPDALNFIVMGDFGRMGEYHQQAVADEMAEAAITADIDFVVSVGDNFYPNGVQSIHDPQWDVSFEDVYRDLSLHVDWLVALGNHDYRGNVQAQIDYAAKSRRWQMPARYYQKTFELEDSASLLLVVIDTNPFIESYHADTNKYFGLNKQDTARQRAWLEETLANAGDHIKWKIVVGHHPLYSGGKRKMDESTIQMRQKFGYIFEDLGVDAYLCGHEHDLQIIKPEDWTPVQYLSGSASEIRPTGSTEGTVFAAAEPGFMLFSLTRKQLQVQIVNAQGNVLFTDILKK